MNRQTEMQRSDDQRRVTFHSTINKLIQENKMGDKGGSRDKGKKEKQKKAKLTPKEKRKAQKDKKNTSS